MAKTPRHYTFWVRGLAVFLPLLSANLIASAAPRQMELLDRGVVAVKVPQGVYVGWRILGTDSNDLTFNVYRDKTRVNTKPIEGASNIIDPKGTLDASYSVYPVVNGAEGPVGGHANVWNSQTRTIPLQRPAGGILNEKEYSYSPNDSSVV